MMSYLHTKFHEPSDCTPRPAFAFGDAGKNNQQIIIIIFQVWFRKYKIEKGKYQISIIVLNLKKKLSYLT